MSKTTHLITWRNGTYTDVVKFTPEAIGEKFKRLPGSHPGNVAYAENPNANLMKATLVYVLGSHLDRKIEQEWSSISNRKFSPFEMRVMSAVSQQDGVKESTKRYKVNMILTQPTIAATDYINNGESDEGLAHKKITLDLTYINDDLV